MFDRESSPLIFRSSARRRDRTSLPFRRALLVRSVTSTAISMWHECSYTHRVHRRGSRHIKTQVIALEEESHMPMNERSGADGGGQGLMHSLQQQASSALSSQKVRAADSMKPVIDAVRQTGESLREKNGTIAGYADSAASQLERFSTQLRDRDVSELMDEVSAFARRQPALFIGGGVALGLIAARFLKSSAPDRMTTSSGMSNMGARGASNWSSATGQSTQQFATAGSSSVVGSPDTMGSTLQPGAAGIAADRTTSRTPRTPRPRTTDER
jgi:hypothetical protein